MFRLADGTKVQRDLYSSFLLYCCDTSDPKNLKIDKQRCRQEFAAQLKKERKDLTAHILFKRSYDLP